jgi:hypothetical protein
MAEYTVLNGDLDILKNVLENSEYFTTVTKVNGSNFGRIEAVKGDLTFKFGEGIAPSGGGTWAVSASGKVTSAARTPGNSGSASDGHLDYEPIGVYECAGGMSIICKSGRIAITKTNNNETAVAFGSCVSESNIMDLAYRLEKNMAYAECIAESDDGDNYTFINNINIYAGVTGLSRRYSQTLLAPLITQSHTGRSSYLAKAKILLYAQSRDVCNIMYNGKRYFSDGYFAIEDPET